MVNAYAWTTHAYGNAYICVWLMQGYGKDLGLLKDKSQVSANDVLCCAMLCCAVLCCAVLCCALLCRAVPCCAVLCRAVLHYTCSTSPAALHWISPANTALHSPSNITTSWYDGMYTICCTILIHSTHFTHRRLITGWERTRSHGTNCKRYACMSIYRHTGPMSIFNITFGWKAHWLVVLKS